MHYGTLVILQARPNDLDEAVEQAMSSGKDQYFDWWQIGGRWTGTLSGYQPEDDPANIEVCSHCNGTGTRTDMTVADGCNGCHGTGKAVKWPTEWARHTGDVVPVETLTQEAISKHFHNIVCDGHGWFGGERYEPWHDDVQAKFQKMALPPVEWIKKEYAGGVAVVVDCHN